MLLHSKSVFSAPISAFLALCVIWGLSWVAIKYSLQDIPPFLGVGLRSAVAAVALALFARGRRISLRVPREDLTLVGLTGVLLYSVNYGLVYWAEQRLTAGVTAVLFATFPIFVSLLNDLLRLEPGTSRWTRRVGPLIAFLGIVVIFHEELLLLEGGDRIIFSCLAVLASAFVAATTTLVARHRFRHLHPVAMTYHQFLMGFSPVLLFSVALGEPASLVVRQGSLLALLYLGVIASALAFVLFYWLLGRMSPVNLSLFVYITPLISILSGWWFLQEVPEPLFLVGTSLILAGVLLCFSGRRPRIPPS